MVDALQGVEAAFKEHTRKLDGESLEKLSAANDRVRDALNSAGR